MANILIADQSQVLVGIDTMTYDIPSTGTYHVQYECTENPPSGLSVLVKNGAATIFTAPVLGDTQQAMQFRHAFLADEDDVITVVLASAEQIDNELNTVKSIISIGAGL